VEKDAGPDLNGGPGTPQGGARINPPKGRFASYYLEGGKDEGEGGALRPEKVFLLGEQGVAQKNTVTNDGRPILGVTGQWITTKISWAKKTRQAMGH